MKILIRILLKLNKLHLLYLSDKSFIKLRYRFQMGKRLNLDNPKTFNEKLQWLKINDRRDIYTTMVDKYEAKKYVANIIGDEYIIPSLGVYNSFEDIDFDKLPNQFVIKCTHDSGGLVIVKDKSKFDYDFAKKKINKCLKNNFYSFGREWPYKNVKPRIIIEQYMEDDEDKELRDYKFFCFNGKFKFMFIASNRQGKGDTYFDFFDDNLKLMPFTNGHPNAPRTPHMPKNIKKMIELAELLSKNIPQIRIDFYEINGKVYFGEMTLFHWSGFMPFDPPEWDEKLGNFIKLPIK